MLRDKNNALDEITFPNNKEHPMLNKIIAGIIATTILAVLSKLVASRVRSEA